MSINSAAVSLLDQVKQVVVQMTDEQFSRSIPTLSDSSIGQHVRHSLEFFLCLQDAQMSGEINYDNRRHDKYLESDVKLAEEVIESLQASLAGNVPDFNMVMKANYQIEKEELLAIPTTYFRELAYNIEHAIHHMALIKIGLKSTFPTIHISEHFGVASSTVRYQKSQNA